MKIEPLFDRVLVKRDPIENKPHQTDSGILLPGRHPDDEARCAMGTVLEVGEGRIDTAKAQTMRVKKGQRVVFGKHAGVAIGSDDSIRIIREEDVLAIIHQAGA